ncbi:MAG: hypothetical protein ACPIG6_02230 [Akkermansiaceae bacterium]
MSGSEKPSTASFPCEFCGKNIVVPKGLPATKAPCPYCSKEVTSPDFSMVAGEVEPLSHKPVAEPSKPATVGAAQDPVHAAKPVEPVVSDMQSHSDGAEPVPIAPRPVQAIAPQSAPSKDFSRITKIKDVPSQAVSGDSAAANKRGERRLLMMILVLLLLVIGGSALWLGGGGLDLLRSEAPSPVAQDTGPSAEELELAWRTEGWKQDASDVLAGFMTAKTPEARMKYAIANDGVSEELGRFYPAGSDDMDTPLQYFVHRTGTEQDHQRGIFRMQYRQPSQTDMRHYFAPIGSLDKAIGVKGATLIDMAHAIDKSHMSAPVEILAFFKKTDEGLKLDASVFMQCKFRTFRSFVDFPRLGDKKIFRVKMSEAIDHEHRENKNIRTYRIEDCAYADDYVNVSVSADSEIGRLLAPLNWRGTDREYQSRTATIELGWSEEKPARLQLERLICWEFLSLGGEPGNTIGENLTEIVPKVSQTSDN